MTQPTTELDLAHQKAQGAQDDPQAQLQFHRCFADSELFLLLDSEAKASAISPLLFPVDGVSYSLVFDQQERMVEFSETPVDYVALPGRAVIALLDGQGVGIGLNLGVAPSSYLMPPGAVEWMAQVLDQPPGSGPQGVRSLDAPGPVPPSLVQAVGETLTRAEGPRALAVFLVLATFEGGDTGHLLAVVGLPSGAEPILRQSLAETVSFSGLDGGRFDLAFLEQGTELAKRIAQVGKRVF